MNSVPVNPYLIISTSIHQLDNIYIWDPKTMAVIKKFENKDPILQKRISHIGIGTGKFISFAKNVVSFWSANNSNQSDPYKRSPIGIDLNVIKGFGNGSLIIAGTKEGKIITWETETGLNVGNINGHIGSINLLSINENLALVISSGQFPTIKMWSIKELSQFNNNEIKCLNEYKGHNNQIVDIDFLLENVISCSNEGCCKCYDIISGSEFESYSISQKLKAMELVYLNIIG